jgi:hypothetical protein
MEKSVLVDASDRICTPEEIAQRKIYRAKRLTRKPAEPGTFKLAGGPLPTEQKSSPVAENSSKPAPPKEEEKKPAPEPEKPAEAPASKPNPFKLTPKDVKSRDIKAPAVVNRFAASNNPFAKKEESKPNPFAKAAEPAQEKKVETAGEKKPEPQSAEPKA